MDDSTFYERFINLLQNYMEVEQLGSKHDALIFWFGAYILRLDPDEIKNRIVEDAHAEGVDAIFFDDENRQFWFIQAKTVESFDHTSRKLPENEIKKTTVGLEFLLTGDYKGKVTNVIEDYVDEFHEEERKAPCQKKLLFLTLKMAPDFSPAINVFKSQHEQIVIDFLDFPKLKKHYEDFLAYLQGPPDSIRMHIASNLMMERRNGVKSVIFSCKGKDIAEIYEDHKERIFQMNVRYFLGNRDKSINEEMIQTAESSQESVNFWYYNNGITMVCSDYNIPERKDSITISKPQIINGAQTTYSLYQANHEGKLRDEVEVLIRIIATDDRALSENITLYSNSQNPIRLRDLRSNDEVQVRVQNAMTSYGYFYERKRGEFEALYPTIDAKKSNFGPDYKSMVISNENAIETYLSFYLNRPSNSKKEKSRFYQKGNGGFYDLIFQESDELLPEKLLLSWTMWKFVVRKKEEYKKNLYRTQGEERTKLQTYDFLLHSEYFVVCLLRDFLEHSQGNITTVTTFKSLISKINNSDPEIYREYNSIVEDLRVYIATKMQEPGYYHNKFFKNDSAIGSVRVFFHSKYDFVKETP